MMLDALERLRGEHDTRARESTARYVFSLIWPGACIDCNASGDCLVMGVSDGAVRHVVRVPCALLDRDQGLTLVRALYRAGLPQEFGDAVAGLSRSL